MSSSPLNLRDHFTAYRYLTGPDDAAFCHRVTQAINNGWSLSGAYLVRQTPSSLATQKFTMLDPQVRLSNGKIYSKGNCSLGTELRANIGLSDASVAATRKGDLRWFQFVNYDINSRWSLGLTTFLRGFAYEQRADDAPLFYVYAGPQVSYSFNDKIQAALLFEYGGLHSRQSGFLATDGTDIEPSVNFQFTPKLSFTPYLDIKTSDRMALDTTTVNANITYRAL